VSIPAVVAVHITTRASEPLTTAAGETLLWSMTAIVAIVILALLLEAWRLSLMPKDGE
jgi:hypothetical protein